VTTGIKFVSYPDHSGYGLAALAYVRALHNAGVPVWWAPMVYRNHRQTTWRPGDDIEELPLACEAGNDASLQDVVDLARVAGPKRYDSVIFQTVPEHWPDLFEAGKRNIGYTVWETDRLPDHWLSLLNIPDRVLVPCQMNHALFTAAGVIPPVSVIPHIRRHAWSNVSPADTDGLRRQLGIPEDHFVFYSIGVWDPRKALGDLIGAFAREFSGHDRVSLVLKTSTRIHPLALEGAAAGGIRQHVHALLDRFATASGRPAPHVALIPADGVAGRVIDTLHAIGDCFVSLAHGEGWGMGAFDAASLGKPVLITGYGGPVDYLGDGYPGLIPYTMTPVSGWTAKASFQAPQNWAQSDIFETGRLMRRMVSRYVDFLDVAVRTSEQIINRYAEPVVARQLIAALDA
jgi:glycosyltransferase involved in cell wall biosynthesis